jgi:hypothetical protein
MDSRGYCTRMYHRCDICIGILAWIKIYYYVCYGIVLKNQICNFSCCLVALEVCTVDTTQSNNRY